MVFVDKKGMSCNMNKDMNKEWYCIEINGLYVGKIFCYKEDFYNEFNKYFLYKIEGNLVKVIGEI